MVKKQTKIKSIEETLWESANKLRGSVEPSEYKHIVLSLIFLKYANDRFDERRNELVEISDDLVFIRTNIDRTDILQDFALLHRHTRDPPHEHLSVHEHLVVALHALQHVGEIPVLPHKRILG